MALCEDARPCAITECRYSSFPRKRCALVYRLFSVTVFNCLKAEVVRLLPSLLSLRCRCDPCLCCDAAVVVLLQGVHSLQVIAHSVGLEVVTALSVDCSFITDAAVLSLLGTQVIVHAEGLEVVTAAAREEQGLCFRERKRR